MDFVRCRQSAARLMGMALVFGMAPFLATAAISAQEATPGAGTACQRVIEHDAAAQTQRLLADCVTDETIFVPNGWTFDGDGHTIAARDPVGGRLQDAVLFIGEGAGDVHDVVIDGSGLEAPCLADGGATVLNGIAFLDSTGEVRRVSVHNMMRAFSANQEQVADGESQRKSCGTGIAIVGQSVAAVAASTIADVGYVGILVEKSSATISSNVVVRAEDTGILALRGAQLEVMPGNQVRYGGAGIQFEGAGTAGNIEGSSVADMKVAGIVAMAEADVVLADTTVEEIDGPGVLAVSGGAVTAERIDIRHAERAFVADGGSVRVQEATLAECMLGVVSVNGGSADVSGSTVQACGIGLAAGGSGSSLTAIQSTITGSERVGVLLEGAAQADLRELRITQSGMGIVATDQNIVDVVDAHIQDTTRVGIVASGGSQVTLTSSGMRKPGEFGVVVSDPGSLLVSSENSIADAAQTGIQVLEGARLETSDTRIYGGETGIAVDGIGSTAQISETFISDTETNLRVTDGAQVGAIQFFTVGGTTGIVISGEGTTATVQESTINRPAQDGVRVQDGGWVSVESSTITDAVGTAISLQRGVELPTAVELVLDENGCTPRVLAFPAGVRTEITFRNAGESRGQIESNIGIALDLAPGETGATWLTSVPAESTLRCFFPGGDGGWEEVILRAIPQDQIPVPPAPAEPLVLHANQISGGSQGIVVGDGVRAVISENTIDGMTGEALTIADSARVDTQNNRIAAGTPSPDTGP